jgi:hypothetical protein
MALLAENLGVVIGIEMNVWHMQNNIIGQKYQIKWINGN